ncbi:MAG: type II toxin-antitoxin system VapC family toxin [Micrococcales bacterium]|nr:type II toxin-antitoxin system VapC family toxin [Micrococcales bacterium]
MTTDIVLDASALVAILIERSARADAVRERMPSLGRHAPHLIDAELGSALRRLEQQGLIDDREAAAALASGRALVDERYAHTRTLVTGAWAHRRNLSFYDALYVALASELGIPLLTADARIARAPRLGCEVQLV